MGIYKGFKIPFVGMPYNATRHDKNGGEYRIIFEYGITRVLRFLNDERVSVTPFYNWNDAIDFYRINMEAA